MTIDSRPPVGGGSPTAPPVVAVMVVHSPGEWFDETLESLARQDYPNLNTLFILTGGTSDAEGEPVAARIRTRMPDAFVRVLEGGPSTGPGFGPAVNAVLDVVEGAAGFFCICHDDVALAPDAVRAMVEELYRANAGIVGPKLVEWDHPRVLQDVGLDVDRFGASAPRVEQGEHDQGQHDGTAEVFAVPSACMLVRADLFRTLGGFDPAMRYTGEDVDLCWRARLTGARVTVAPRARVRHRGDLALRRPDLNLATLRARNEVRAAITLSPGSRLPLLLAQLIGIALLELVAGLFTGRLAVAWASLRALVGASWRSPTFLARRGSVAKLRRRAGADTDATVGALHAAGSNRLRSYGRVREMRTLIGVEDNIRRWRERSIVPAVTWGVVVFCVLIASRTFIDRGLPAVGQFLPFPDGVGDLWSAFRSGWNPNGLGATAPNPSGLAALAVGSVAWLFDLGAGPTVLVVGLVLAGGLGAWRLGDLFPSSRERIVALVVYVAMPLVPGVISTGRLGALVAYAAVPWFVHLVRVAVGIGTADPASASVDLTDGILAPGWRERVRRTAIAGIVVALAAAIAPPVLVIVAAVAVVLGASSLLVGTGWRTAAWLTGTGLVAAGCAWLLNLPAAAAWGWHDFTASPVAGPSGRSLVDVATMDIGRAQLGVLAIALYVPVLAGLLLSAAWRLTWAARAAGLVTAFGALAVLHEREALPLRLPETGYLLAPVALGLALAAACAVASFASDVAAGSFGWRQPLGVAAVGAVAVGMFPSLLTITDGAWYAPSNTMASLVEPELRPDPDFGDFRVLYLGDTRLLPGAAVDVGELGDVEGGFRGETGIGALLTPPGMPGIAEIWPAAATGADDQLDTALRDIAANATQRGGRLLAPFAIRYIVVPVHDGAVSTPNDSVPVPDGLLAALDSQLDLQLLYSPPNYVLYENTSAFPGVALFTGGDAASVAAATTESLVRTDLTSGRPVLGTALDDLRGGGEVEAGVLHVAVPFDARWRLTVGGEQLRPRPGFGAMTAFDVPAAGRAQLAYEQPGSRSLALGGQLALWVAAAIAASRVRLPGWISRIVPRPGSHAASGDDAGTIDLDVLEAPESMVPTKELVRPAVPVMPGDPLGPRQQPLYAAEDAEAKAAWVDEMFAGEDDDDEDDEPGAADDPAVRPQGSRR